ncbi:MAG: isocitrate/isopropylmalate dehydrogenase family protein [Planctomycetaceae bacterium]
MTRRQFNIAVLPGDGIGPEVTSQAVRLLQEIEPHLNDVTLQLTQHSAGVGEYLSSGDALPDFVFEACRTSDAILLGAMGLPSVRYPDGREIVPQIDLRERLDLYGGVRPIRLYHENDTPLKDSSAGDIDFVLVRESTEGLFSRRNALPAADASQVCDTMTITRDGAERVCRLAFQIARTRRRRVTLVDKANVLSSMVFFRRVFDSVAEEFPDCEAGHVYVDAAALFLVRDPRRFDVLVTENMFGDILSDLAAGLIGGLGMAPSADIGDRTAVFQPVHGSAPDIAGQGIANPIAMILSTAMMLEWLPHEETKRAGQALRDAVVQVLSDPAKRTADMGGTLTTTQMTDAVSEALKRTIGG